MVDNNYENSYGQYNHGQYTNEHNYNGTGTWSSMPQSGLEILLGLLISCSLLVNLHYWFFPCYNRCKQGIQNYQTNRDLSQIKIEGTKECSICLEEYNTNDNIIILDCNHIFHRECISKWFHNKDIKNCPLCRIII